MDYFYCVSNTGMNHCLWILDSKLQVWKCTGERDEFCAQQCNWNLEKKQNLLKFEEIVKTYLASSLNLKSYDSSSKFSIKCPLFIVFWG